MILSKVRKQVHDHLRREIDLRRDRVKALEDKGEPVPVELIVEIEAFQRELIRAYSEKIPGDPSSRH